MKNILMCCLFASFAIAFPQEKQTGKTIQITAKVIGIKDGDTIDVLYHQLPLTIRLEHIDAPETRRGQAFSKVAKKKLSELCFGKEIQIQSQNGFDRNGRLLAEIFTLEGININQEMVRLGYAWHFTKYSQSTIYQQLQEEAQKDKRGLWIDKQPIAPWDFRKKTNK